MDFEILKNLFDNYVISKFHKAFALFTTLFIVFWLLLSMHVSIRSDFDYEWYLYEFIFGFIIMFWLFYKYKWPYPKNKPVNGIQKTGLIIAIYAENYEGIKTKNKFIRELERQFNDAGLNNFFNILILPNHYSEKIKNNNDLEKIHKKIDGHIYFYGDIQKEKDGKNKKKYFLNLDGYVKHLPIPVPVSRELAYDFRAVLPKEINFDDFFELRGCKATAKIVYLASKYVTGVASFLSGNPFMALELHKNLVKELNEYKKIDNDKKLQKISKFDLKHIKLIKNKIPIIISGEALIIARIYHFNNNKEKALEFLELSLKNNSNNYEAWLLKAIFDFLYNDDPIESFESIKKAKRYSKNQIEWKYSWSFLKFWLGEYEDAYKMCVKIKDQNFKQEIDVIEQVENFNLAILSKHSKPQLFFWIGYLNYKKKNNLQKSLEYFDNFIKLADRKNDEFLIKKASMFLVEIKQKINQS